MAQVSRFYSSLAGDRVYSASDFCNYFYAAHIQNGVELDIGNGLSTTTAAYASTIKSGNAFFNGIMYQNTTDATLAHTAVASGSKRIDYVVVRFDTVTARSAVLTAIEGVATTGTPAAPAITTATDLPLYQVLIDNTSGTPVYTLTDSRYIFRLSGSPKAGTITMTGGATADAGNVLCDGSSYLRTGIYADLFARISTTFGSADGTHFNVPDFRGIYPKGAGTTARAAGKDANGNYYAATLGSYTTDKMQGHRHPPITGANAFFTNTANTNQFNASTPNGGTTNATTGDPVTDTTNGTPRTGMTTEPQNLGIAFQIKL